MAAATTNKVVLSSTPTFTLRRIDPREIYEKYIRGDFSQTALPTQKIAVHVAPTVLEPTLSNSPTQGIYMFKLKNNSTQVIATSNSIPFEYYLKNGEELPTGGLCPICGKDFTEKPLGIPIKMVEKANPDGSVVVQYFLDDCVYCSFECTFSGYKRYRRACSRYSDPLYLDSEQLLRFMYRQAYPQGGILKEAPDSRLSSRFGGSLDDEAFHCRKHVYNRTPNVIHIPIKVQYQRSS
jgi:hypothetical protein